MNSSSLAFRYENFSCKLFFQKNATAEEKPKVPEVIRVTLKTKEKYTNAHMMSKEDVAEAKKM